jgi:N-acetylglutamate synthase-like GNAT family acetyltransferase
MANLDIIIESGKDARKWVDPFYQGLGSKTRARDEDVFFYLKNGDVVTAAVRFCIEVDVALLRGMYVAPALQKRGIGSELLKAFEKYLVTHKVSPTYCIAYNHLEEFYGQIGFKFIEATTAPKFLNDRLMDYIQDRGNIFIIMKRD